MIFLLMEARNLKLRHCCPAYQYIDPEGYPPCSESARQEGRKEGGAANYRAAL